MRAVHPLAIAALVVALAPSAARAQGARDLDAPYVGAPEAPRRPRGPAPPAGDPTSGPLPAEPLPVVDADGMQRIGAVPAATVAARTFGDGHGDELSWDDPELDVEPRGWVHVVLVGSGVYLGSTPSFDEAGGGTLALALDIVLVPSVSLHLRLGAMVSVRTETRRATAASEMLRSAVLTVRGTALVGAHLAQIVALRAGFELGEGRSFVFDVASGATVGLAFLGQAGLRLAKGRFELGVEVAAELREGNVLHPTIPARSVQELAPRLGGYISVTL